MKGLYVVALALVLAGCGGDPPPAAPAAPSPTSSSTAVAAPVMPELAKEDSKEGAVAFVRYYVELINHAQETGDITGLESASWKNCQACTRVTRAIDRLYGTGGRIEGGRWTSSREFAQFDRATASWLVVAHISYPQQISIEPGARDHEFKGGAHAFHFQVKFVKRPMVMSWLIAD